MNNRKIVVIWEFILHFPNKNQLGHSRRNLSLSDGLLYRFRITGTTDTSMFESDDGFKMWMKYLTLALSVCKMHHLDKLHIWIVLPRC